MSAVVAGIGRASRNAVMLALNAALLAGRNTAGGKTHFLDRFEAGVIIRKFGTELRNGILLRLVQNVVSALDIAHVIRRLDAVVVLLVVKG